MATTFSLKQGETRTSHGSIPHPLDYLLQKNVIVNVILIVLFFGNQVSKWRSFKKGLFLTYFSHFLVTRKKLQKFLQHISHSYTHTYFVHLIDFFCLTNFEKKNRIYQIRFLFGMSPGPYFIKVKIILSLKFKINLIFYLIKEFMKHSCLNFFYEIVNTLSIKVRRN